MLHWTRWLRTALPPLACTPRPAPRAPEVRQVFAAQGITAVGSPADGASAFLQSELDKHSRLAKSSGATLD